MTYPGQQYPGQQFPGQPQYPGYAPAPQGYPQPAPQQGAQLAAGSIDDFFSQPSVGGGPALKFDVGTVHVGIVARAVSNADIQQQTNPSNGQPAFYKDGRPKFVMRVPLQVQPTQLHPDGQAQWYVSGGARDELVRAMAESGAPAGPPEAGAAIRVECTGTRPAGVGMNPAKVYKVVYRRPAGAAAAPTTAAPVVVQAPAPVQEPAPAPSPTPSPTPAVQATPPAAPQPPADLDPAQQELLRSLGG